MIAQEYSDDFDAACAPFQYALSTRAGTECVAHIFQALTQANPSTTILSIDGIGAYDLISRRSMLSGLMALPQASAALPFTRMFYGQPSEYLWYDDDGAVHSILQAEGGEQGDPLMPALFALGQPPHYRKCRPLCMRASLFLLSWMMCTLSVSLEGLVLFLTIYPLLFSGIVV